MSQFRATKIEVFAGGVLVGIAVCGVAAAIVGASRRAGLRARWHQESRHEIDGVHPPDTQELAAQPMREGNGIPRRLESERGDIAPLSERW